MAISDILATIDQQIAQLQQAKAVLSGGIAPTAKKKAGRPKKVVALATTFAPVKVKPARKKRKLSAEGRKRIAEAAKKRWAAKRAAAK
ncbi:MAG: hypothetical protein ABR906_02760 [Terracidiphilus sp.]|jgi:hypothetical protein